jgi:hypothetical protein
MKRAAVLALSLLMTVAVTGQSCSTCPTEKHTWPFHFRPRTNVVVWIDPAFDSDAVQAIRGAFHAWQAHPANNTKITFTFTQDLRVPTGENVFEVRRETPDPLLSDIGETLFNIATQRAYTRITPALTSMVGIRNTMAHEIGHAMGLTDCAECCAESSVMAGVPVRGDPNTSAEYGLGGPTTCDLAQVVAIIGGGSVNLVPGI